MQNFDQPGRILEMTAPAGGVTSGTGYLIGGLYGVAVHDADATEKFSFAVEGVYTLPKEATTAAFTEGERVFWDDTAKEMDESAAGRYHAGVAVEAAIATDATVKVKLLGFAESAVV